MMVASITGHVGQSTKRAQVLPNRLNAKLRM